MKHLLRMAWAATAWLWACGTEPITVTTPNGRVRGTTDGETLAFLGIPYAKPPIAERRFAAPEAIEPWNEVREASEPAAPCAQLKMGSTDVLETSSEDCLYLNVWAPKGKGRYPVMVWIPGGAYVIGHGAEAAYDGKRLAEQRDVVVVTINYRLSAFGFLGHSALRDAEGSSGNYGLLDQREALRWVQRNIGAFHGDPGNVTLFGESAGGGSTCMHLISPGSAGLFHRAIVESGPCTVFDMPTREASEAQGAELAAQLGCSGEVDSVVECLRAADFRDVLRALQPNSHFIYGDGVAWYPVVDGEIVPEQPAKAFANGASSAVPLIIGANSDEATAFFGGDSFPDVVKVREVLDEIFGAQTAGRALERYDASKAPKAEIIRIVSDGMICDARRIARAHAAHGGTVFQYHFTQGFFDPLLSAGAFHTAEIGYVFGNGMGLPLPPASIPLKNLMQGYWTHFAATGDPNGRGAPHWPRYSSRNDESMRLDLAVERTQGVRRELCDFWDGLRNP